MNPIKRTGKSLANRRQSDGEKKKTAMAVKQEGWGVRKGMRKEKSNENRKKRNARC